MADILRIKAERDELGINWSWVDETMYGHRIIIEQMVNDEIKDGDIWHAEVVDLGKKGAQKFASLRLVSKIQELKPWQSLNELPDNWFDQDDLENVLIWLNNGIPVRLIGPSGTGKTQFGYALAKALGWQQPCKVDVSTIKQANDIFGMNAAESGSTFFARSALFDYIERAIIAYKQGLDTRFLVIFDEINRVHSKSNQNLHGLFDDTRQVTINTSDRQGFRTIILPPNMAFLATMNENHAGTFELDASIKSRFQPIKVGYMPEAMEVRRLVDTEQITEEVAQTIVKAAWFLRRAYMKGELPEVPDFRACRSTAMLIRYKDAPTVEIGLIKGFLAHYQGELKFDEDGNFIPTPHTDVAKAYSALKMANKDLKRMLKEAVS